MNEEKKEDFILYLKTLFSLDLKNDFFICDNNIVISLGNNTKTILKIKEIHKE